MYFVPKFNVFFGALWMFNMIREITQDPTNVYKPNTVYNKQLACSLLKPNMCYNYTDPNIHIHAWAKTFLISCPWT